MCMSSNQTKGATEESRVVMVDKVIHVSQVTSDKVDALTIPNEEPGDNLQNATLGVDQCNHDETIDQSNSKTRQEDILLHGSSVLGNTQAMEVSEHC